MVNDNIKTKQDFHPKLTGGLILILLGILFLLAEMERISWADWWAYFLAGLGGIFRSGISGRLIAGLILVIIGGSYLIGFTEWWPLILIAVGVVILASAFLKK
jgi:hypothetical protein